MSVFIYTFEDCMNACVSYNSNGADERTHNGSSCAGVSYSYTQTRDLGSKLLGGNCWLKNSSDVQQTLVSWELNSVGEGGSLTVWVV
jgi:hypothetical protein